jgi:hypothetical protein
MRSQTTRTSRIPIVFFGATVSVLCSCSNTIITSNGPAGGATAAGAAATGGASAATGGSGVGIGGTASGTSASDTSIGGASVGGVSTVGTFAGGTSSVTAIGGAATGGTSSVTAIGGAATGGTSSVTAIGGAATGGASSVTAIGGAATGGTSTGAITGGATATGGTVAGGASVTGGAGGISTTSPCAAVAASVHGKVEPLADNLCRISYDFSDAQQLLDWNVAAATDTQLSLVNQLMLVSYPASANSSLAGVQFKLPLRVTRLAFRGATIEGGQHMNAYLAVQWTGEWSPSYGYGCIINDSNRMFTVGGTSIITTSTLRLTMNRTYDVEILMTSSQISWTMDNDTTTYQSLVLYPGKDRNLVLGGWMSTVAFDDVVIEGEF